MASRLYKAYCRAFQKLFLLGLSHLSMPDPELIKGSGSLNTLAAKLKEKNINDILLVTYEDLSDSKHFNDLKKSLEEQQIRFAVYNQVIPNPSLDCVEAGAKVYKENNCNALIAFGGGSAIDCAKAIGIRIVRPKTSFGFLRGSMKVLCSIPYLVAIPTTAGTGSETTLAAVLTDESTHEKYPINDSKLTPKIAVLETDFTVSLTPELTATTGMDAFVHAIEAYIGGSNFGKTEETAIEAGQLISKYLKKAYDNGQDMEARENMQHAAFLAGYAFTRAYVGYVHAIAHSLGGMYHTPHGLANAVLQPYVLESYGVKAHKRLAAYARAIGVIPEGLSDKETAEKFIAYLREMNRSMNIPEHLENICAKDIPTMAKSAAKEGNPLYPVPEIFTAKELEKLYYTVAGDKLV